jgi:CubicO group peptidase (beta-lactamase class C family)
LDFSALAAEIERRRVDLGVPSIAVGVAVDGKTEWVEAFGFADLERGTPATIHTPYSLASVTKPMIGMALVKLTDQGKLDLERPINDYLSPVKLTAWAGDENAATVWRVANHTAGLPLHFQFFFEGDTPPPPDETVRRHGNIVEPPGEAYTYSNLGYGILGFVIEHVSGKSLPDFVQAEIFAPLGMANSAFAPASKDFESCAARYDLEGKRLPYYTTDHPGASEAFASIQDLLRFGLYNFEAYDTRILKESSLNRMRSPQTQAAADQRYGIGWALSQTVGGHKVVSHSGSMDGVLSRLILVPERRVVIAILSNRDSPLVDEAQRAIYSALDIHVAPIEEPTQSDELPQALQGPWQGAVHTCQGDIDLTLDTIGHRAWLDGQATPVHFTFTDGRLQGTIQAQLRTSDAERTSHSLFIKLRPQGNAITGVVTARSLPGPRVGNALSYPTTLNRLN